MSLSLKLIHEAYLLSLRNSHRSFQKALKRPRATQEKRLNDILSRNTSSAFGQQHGFQKIRSISDYQEQVPIAQFDDKSPWIERIKQGEKNVLTSEPVLMFEPTGGSTQLAKHIPYTRSLLNEFSAATNPWLYNLFSQVDGLKGTQSYWSISMAKPATDSNPAGISIGFTDDTEYFNPLARYFLNRMMAVPGEVAHSLDMDSWRRETLTHLLKADNLGLISIWSPTFLSLLMEHLQRDWSDYAAALPTKRRDEIEQALQVAGKFTGEALWPKLKLISCWTDSTARPFSDQLQSWFPNTLIQSKGLLATEGVVTLPLFQGKACSNDQWDVERGCEVAVSSHFYEFIDLDHPDEKPLLVDQLKPGAQYSPVLTTGGGLYRYQLRDIVTCTGMTGETPRLRFEGKLDRVSDLCGEKLHSGLIEKAMRHAREATGCKPQFELLAPSKSNPPHYQLFLEGIEDDASRTSYAKSIDQYLQGNHHYQLCRKLGQLTDIEAREINQGWQQYQATLERHGQRAGDIKPAVLDDRFDWQREFS